MALSDGTIRLLAHRGMIKPYSEKRHFGGMSYGLSPNSYDFRLDQDIWLWPGRFVLASTIERVKMPTNVTAVVHDKSSWARCGVSVFNTVIDAGFEGNVTLEISLRSFRFMRIKRGTAICQFIFHSLDKTAEKPYDGKYQGQRQGPVKAIKC